jgi:hypothetical protein
MKTTLVPEQSTSPGIEALPAPRIMVDAVAVPGSISPLKCTSMAVSGETSTAPSAGTVEVIDNADPPPPPLLPPQPYRITMNTIMNTARNGTNRVAWEGCMDPPPITEMYYNVIDIMEYGNLKPPGLKSHFFLPIFN